MSGPPAKKRKLSTKTFAEKLEILKFIKDNPQMKQKLIAEHFQIKPQTLSDLMKKRETIEAKCNSSKFVLQRTRNRKSELPDVDHALIIWFREMASKPGVVLNGEILQMKANEFAKQMEHDNVDVSMGWIDRFKKRYGIGKIKQCGDAAGVQLANIEHWKSEMLPKILREFVPSNIYNLDETGLFWQTLPENSLGFIRTGAKHHGVKQPKSRVTILLGTNMDGTNKLPLLMIGRYKQPRAFKGLKQYPLKYLSNKNAWMTGSIFLEHMRALDRDFKKQNRHVAFILDNCSAHPAEELQHLENITFFFLPSNTTSHTQPLDGGIIKNFKVHYRRRLCQKRLTCAEAKVDFVWSLLDASIAAKSAWDEVTPLTIQNCFAATGFKTDVQPTGHIEEAEKVALY
jgi:hypothetical protein